MQIKRQGVNSILLFKMRPLSSAWKGGLGELGFKRDWRDLSVQQSFIRSSNHHIWSVNRGRTLGHIIGTKVLLFAVTSTNGFYSPPPPLSKSGLKLVCNIDIVYGNLKSENSQDNAQKPQRNCMFKNSASEQVHLRNCGQLFQN
jgi:hypothetical protein